MKNIFYFFVIVPYFLGAQTTYDSLKVNKLKPLEVVQQKSQFTIDVLPEIKGTYIFAGKKSEVVHLQGLDASITDRNTRQIFSKIPGIFVYDMDGAGNQINIASRGLDPHRGWEFNIRKDGAITNTDLYAYPASHFSIPMEAIQNIELVRGTASLQYGSQFGGMLNYVLKEPDNKKKIQYQTTNSIGSFGLMSTYHELNGKIGKFRYMAYLNKRIQNGYRESSGSSFNAESFKLIFEPNSRFTAKLDISHSKYLIHLAGPLSDAMFEINPRMAIRNRNFYQPDIFVPSLSFDFILSEKTKISWLTSAVYGQRSSVMFDRPSNVLDLIDPNTLQYANRQVDIDNYHSHNSEVRLLHSYNLGNWEGNLSAGVQGIYNVTDRKQQGLGSTGNDFDLQVEGLFGRDIRMLSRNLAFFVENQFKIGQNFLLSPGFRIENGSSKIDGTLKYAELFPFNLYHRFPLFGINAQYKFSDSKNLYLGWSEAYRPVLFKDLIPGSIYEKTDPNIRDSKGWNTEIGYRLQNQNFKFDINYFGLMYLNRPGTLANEDPLVGFNILRTNIGDSFAQGIEAFLEYLFKVKKSFNIIIFTSTAAMDARYINGQIRVGEKNINIKGNKVESTPNIISRNGLTIRAKKYSSTLLFSFTSKSFADALNTVEPSVTGSVGLVDSYGIIDFNQTYRINQNMNIKLNINNLFNKSYFTKRPQMYPGPGIWPSDGRSTNIMVSFGI